MTLSIPELPPGCDVLTAALTYARAGWFVLPIDRASKHAGSVVGKKWQDQSSRDPQEIAAWFSGTNYGLALHVGRSGAVAFDVDQPAAAPEVLVEAVKALQPPHQSTRTAAPGRGHYLFAAEAGSIGNSLGDLPDGWGEIRGFNGIVVVEPTPHEKAAEGGQYTWGRRGELPALPEALRTQLRPPGGHKAVLDEPVVRDWVAGLSAGEPSAEVAAVPLELPETGRHGEMNKRVMQLVRLAEQGHPGVPNRLAALRDTFVAAVGEERRNEFRRGLLGAVAEVLGNPTPVLPDVDLPDDLAQLAAARWAAREAAAGPSGGEGGAGGVDFDPTPAPERRVDLTPWLNGTWAPPVPSRGMPVESRAPLLYPGRWHSMIGPTAAGKSWAALAHTRAEIEAGRAVVYCHFEESLPGGTVARMLSIGIRPGVIKDCFIWLDCDRQWAPGEFSAMLNGLVAEVGFDGVGLVILDGINAAATRHGYDPSEVRTVGWYRHNFVTPATHLGAAVLSLGHPPKARDRQDERHGIGSTAWLDEVDGVGFRLVPAKGHPIRRGTSGASTLYSVKDRYGEVERHGVLDDTREGWCYLGSLTVDDHPGTTTVRLVPPKARENEQGQLRDEIDDLADAIVKVLLTIPGQHYEKESDLRDKVRAARHKFKNDHWGPAMERLEESDRLDRDPYLNQRAARGGRLRASAVDFDPTDLEASDA